MTKKQNTLLFIAIGTIVEVLMAFIFIVLLLVICTIFCKDNQALLSILFSVAIILGVVASMVIYQRLASWAIQKFNLEDKLDPLLPKKYLGRNRRD